MEGRDPVEVIREALAKALVPYYPLAGRLTEGKERELTVECTGEGVLFVEADANVKLEDFGERLPQPLPWIKDLLVDAPGSDGIIGCPLLLIQVTRLTCGGFIFTCRLNHTISDAQGISQFLHAVAEIARGAASSPTIHPISGNAKSFSGPAFLRASPALIFTENLIASPNSKARPCHPLNNWCTDPSSSGLRKNQVPFPCTSFEVVAAFVWHARSIALRLDLNDELWFMFPINVRSLMNPPIPAGYYGNAFLAPCVLSTVRNLCESPLSHAVKLVQETKEKVTDEYIKSSIDLMVIKGELPIEMIDAPTVYYISDNSRAGLADVDYGWENAVYGGPATGGLDDLLPGHLSFYVAYKNEMGENGKVVPMSLPSDAMERLSMQVEKLVAVPVT